jgi:HAE1 family hydrophobic/amphiphilic exporter-1
VRIRDIGQAIDGAQNAYFSAFASVDKTSGLRPAVLVIITKMPGANVVATADRIRAELPGLIAAMPAAMDVSVLADRTGTIRASVADVEFTLVLSVVLVVLVVLVFLRDLRATAVPAVVLPLAILGTAAVMLPLGFSLDNLSLMALTIAVGFVVDDAIVVIENIYRHVEDGQTPFQAALKGSGEIGFTVVSISLSLVAVFIPLFLMEGIIGRLLREFAAVVSLAVLISMVLSLTLTPMLCARLLRSPQDRRPGRLSRGIAAVLDGLAAVYARALDAALRFRGATLVCFFATIALTGWLFVVIPKGFFPEEDNGFIYAIVETAQDASFEALRRDVLAIAAVVRQDPDVESFGTTIPGPTPNTALMTINLVPKTAGRTATIETVMARLQASTERVAGARLLMQAAQDIVIGGLRTRTQYQYTLRSADLSALNAWAPKLVERMRAMPELTEVASDQLSSAPAATITIDRERAARWGIQPGQIDAVIYDAIGQRLVTQYFTPTQSYYVVLEVTPEAQRDPAVLGRLYVTSPTTGGQVPLSALVTVDTDGTALLAVNHENLFPSVTVSFNLAPGAALGDAADAIEAASRELGLPASITASFQGTAGAFQESLDSLPVLILAAFVAVYIILGVLYESLVHPLTILSTLPSAGLGALAALHLGGFDLSLIGIIGLLLLIGIVKKNGIMLVDFALERQREGMTPHDAIRAACLLRFRPIMMTTLTAMLAGLPLILGTGPGAELRWPLGIAIVGGLAVSQLLTLLTTPVIFLTLAGAAERLGRLRAAARPG